MTVRVTAAIAAGAVAGAAVLGLMIGYEVQLSQLTGDIRHTNASLTTIQGSFGSVGTSLTGLSQLTQLRHGVNGLLPELQRVNTQLTHLRANTAQIAVLPVLREQLAILTDRFQLLDGQLSGLDQGIGELSGQVAPLRPMAVNVGTMTAALQELVSEFARLQNTLRQMEGHLANLDHKTGPPPPNVGSL